MTAPTRNFSLRQGVRHQDKLRATAQHLENPAPYIQGVAADNNPDKNYLRYLLDQYACLLSEHFTSAADHSR
ncbi:hypothetical protein ACF8C6_13870 [Pseudomonas sp. zbq_18]|uniref:hypothetical protein n=1 Tax=Pseudomonas sp. zbq_18 TaxID=3367251 RepID=UPI00370BF5CF